MLLLACFFYARGMKSFPIKFEYKKHLYTGLIYPVDVEETNKLPAFFRIVLNNKFLGNISRRENIWSFDGDLPQEIVNIIGDFIFKWIV